MHIRSLSTALLWPLSFTLLVNGRKGDSGCGSNAVCVNATVTGDVVTYELTPLSNRAGGWLALGFGQHMVGSHMVILWQNEDKSITLTQRIATGYQEPEVVHKPPRVASLPSPRFASWRNPQRDALAFQIPLNKTQYAANSVEHVIFAYGLNTPQSSSPDIRSIGQHFFSGTMTLDLSKDLPDIPSPPAEKPLPVPAPAPVPPASDAEIIPSKPLVYHERLMVLHGLVLSLGFLFWLPLGSLIARWGRTFTGKWFVIHRLVNFYISLPIITIGWLLGPYAAYSRGASHASDTHKIVGFGVMLIYLTQLFLGTFIHARKVKALTPGPPHPPFNILHVVVGIFLVCLAYYQVGTGLSEWQSATGRLAVSNLYLYTWRAWLPMISILYLFGLILLPRQFRQERANPDAGRPSSDYISLGGVSPMATSHVNVASVRQSVFAIDDEEDQDTKPLLSEP